MSTVSHFASFLVFSLFLHLHQGKSQIPSTGNVIGEIGGFKLPKLLTHEVPALFVFGDSFSDSGNNNFLDTTAKANFLPYGMDFHGKPGRFSNGKTTPDFIAETLGLPLPPPCLGLSESEKKTIVTGVNYASGACGILPDSVSSNGTCLNLDKQIDLFENTAKSLKGQFKSSEDFDQYLSKSLFYVDIGTNDFGSYNFFRNLNLRKQYNTTQAFGEFLSQELDKRLQRLHSLGARKLFVTNLAPLGSIPSLQHMQRSFIDLTDHSVLPYNTYLSAVLTRLQATLPGIKIVQADVHKLFEDLLGNPTKFGFTDSRNSCCNVRTNDAACEKNTTACKDVNQHVFFDGIHRTEATNFLLAARCFNETSICFPTNLNQLILA